LAVTKKPYPTITWVGGTDGHAELIDQTLLPNEIRMIEVRDERAMWHAIRTLQIRGAPAIGIAAAYGVVLGIKSVPDHASLDQAVAQLDQVRQYLASSRPTAVNLFWALDRMNRAASDCAATDVRQLKERLLAEAKTIHAEDAAMCRAIGRHGWSLILNDAGVLTHCNAGGLATAEFGTALALMYTAKEQGRVFHVFADETRPLLQGARLTAWELSQADIDVTLICDNMAGFLMSRGKINLVVTGADRIAANGDAANKIGTYSLAVLANAHKIPFYIAAPTSTFDLATPTGDQIPIEERPPHEITRPGGVSIAPAGINVYNPAFDVTPHHLITAIITEKGIIQNPDARRIADFLHANP
jgi:methylthioribose-1-phosphate isomerase